MNADVGVVFDELGDSLVGDAALPQVDISERGKSGQMCDAVVADVRVVDVHVFEVKRARERLQVLVFHVGLL